MKIAHVVDSMEVGGVETLVAQMCAMQRDLGHEPIVFVIGSLGPLGKRMLSDGFDVRVSRSSLEVLSPFGESPSGRCTPAQPDTDKLRIAGSQNGGGAVCCLDAA